MVRGIWRVLAVVTALTALGCSSGGGSEYGPLAVVDGPPNGNEARTEGVLGIADDCVTLRLDDGSVTLLAWSADAVTWDGDARQIGVSNRDGERRWLADGQPVVLGGSGQSFVREPGAESISRAEWEGRFAWVMEPDPGCEFDEAWFDGGVGEP